MQNCTLAMQLMGGEGTRHDRGVEKLLRDAKLLQIYEGTNEINRLNLFWTGVGPSLPNVPVFDEPLESAA